MTVNPKNPLIIVDAIDEITKAASSLTTRSINSNTDDPEDVQTVIKKGINLYNIKQLENDKQLPLTTIITTFLWHVKYKKPHLMSSEKLKEPVIKTDLCTYNHDWEVALSENWAFAFKFEEEIEKYKRLKGTVTEAFIEDIEELGIQRYQERGFHAIHRLHYKFVFK